VAVLAWRDGRATVRTLVDGTTEEIAADALVIAETPAPEDDLAAELAAAGGTIHRIGDCVSARRASLAFYEGRELGRRL
jgi:2,4-dienoyl-CoA reductase (NADPH2)